MAEFVSDKADVPESRVRVRLGAVVTGRRPVDRLGNRAVVGRGTILAESSARSLDGVAVSLDLRCGQVDAIRGQRLGKGLDQAADQPFAVRGQVGILERRLWRPDLDLAGDTGIAEIYGVDAVLCERLVRPGRGSTGAGSCRAGRLRWRWDCCRTCSRACRRRTPVRPRRLQPRYHTA